MDVTPRGLWNSWVPKTPTLFRTILRAPLGWSPNSPYQDWLTEIIVQSARPILQTPAALLKSQNFFRFDLGVWGKKWISKYTVPAPDPTHSDGNILVSQLCDRLSENQADPLTIRQAIGFGIRALSTHSDELSCSVPAFNPSGVEVEWSCFRTKARLWSRMPSGLSNRAIYNRMLQDLPQRSESPVILYAHGGAFCLMDPANHRGIVTRLAKLADARLVNVRYRLSPQAIFPAALMDMFLTYLALINPPPNSFHEPVPGSKIILAGDSSGGNLVTALQVLLSTLISRGVTRIRNPWSEAHEDSFITIPNPPTAALSVVSPWLDITRSLPSCTLNSRYDFIAPPEPLAPSLLSTSPMFPPDEIWPAKPVRTETYCEAVMCAHPLVSSVITPIEVLAHFPGVYACTGWEGMTDETEFFLRRLGESQHADQHSLKRARDANPTPYSPRDNYSIRSNREIVFDGHIGMPHCFAAFEYNKAGVQANRSRADHIKTAIHQSDPQSQRLGGDAVTTTRATWTNVKTGKKSVVPISQLGMTSDYSGYIREKPLSDEFVLSRVEEGRAFRVDLEKRLRKDEQERETDVRGAT